MLRNKLRSMNPNTDCFNDNQPGDPISFRARILSHKRLAWVVLILTPLLFSVDFLTAAQQQRLLEVTLTRHIMAALQQDADKPIDRSLRAHWITPDADGNIEGRISDLDTETAEASPIGFLTVTLMQKGREVNKSKTDRDGRFILEEVKAGVYTLLAFGETGFLAYGVHVLPRLEELDLEDDVLDSDEGELELDEGELELDEGVDLNVRNSDRTPLSVKQRQAWYVSHFDLPVDAVIAEELQIDAAAVPPEFSSLEKISRNYLSASSAFSILADKGDLKGIGKANLTSGGFQFPLSPAGHFNGRLQPIATEDGRPAKLSDMNLFLIQDDVEILRVAAEENGDFRMEDIEPGVYSLIAAGEDGFAALSLELVTADEEDEENAGPRQPNEPDANTFRRVSTAGAKPAPRQENQPQVNVPALGIAIVTDKEDLKMINKTVKRIFDLRLARNGLAQNRPPIRGFNGGNLGGFAPGGFAPGGFAPSGFASAPASFAPTGISPAAINAAPLTPGIGPAGLSFGAGPSSILGLAGLAGGVIAIADDDSSAPPPQASPSTLGS